MECPLCSRCLLPGSGPAWRSNLEAHFRSDIQYRCFVCTRCSASFTAHSAALKHCLEKHEPELGVPVLCKTVEKQETLLSDAWKVVAGTAETNTLSHIRSAIADRQHQRDAKKRKLASKKAQYRRRLKKDKEPKRMSGIYLKQ